MLDRHILRQIDYSGGFQNDRKSPAGPPEETTSSLEANFCIVGIRRFSTGRISRKQGDPIRVVLRV